MSRPRRRRNSWDGSDQAESPEMTTAGGHFRARRSLAHIFSSFGKGGKQTQVDRKGRVTSSDKATKRKGNDKAERAKSQFYIDLTDGNNLEDPSFVGCSDLDVEKNIPHQVHLEVPPVGVLKTKERSSSLPTEYSSTSSPRCDIEIKVEGEDHIDPPEALQLQINQRPKKPPAFVRGNVGRKSHTQLGVLVIPDSLRESRLYRDRVSSRHQHPTKTTMGSDYSKESVEDEEEESLSSSTSSSSSSSISNSEITSNGVSSATQQQYSSVVSQLCDYLYSTPILPSTHHSYHHHHHHHHHHNYANGNKRPPIKPKPKVIPSPRFKVTTTTATTTTTTTNSESVKETIKVNRNERVSKEQATVGVIDSDDPKVVKSESGDSTGNDHDLQREMSGQVDLIPDPPLGENMIASTHRENCNGMSQESDTRNSDGVTEPKQIYQKVSPNSILQAEIKPIRIITQPVDDIMPVPKTNSDKSDAESRTLPCEPPLTTIPSPATTSSMSVAVSCDNTNLVVAPTNNNSPELTPKHSPELDSTEKRDKKIFNIARELMTSERVFVDVLKLLNVDFRTFIFENMADNLNRISPSANTSSNNNNYKVSKNLMHEEDVNKILNYLPQLQNLNEEILKDLEGRITDWERHRKISDVIVRKGPFLKLYSAYIKEFQSQCDHLEDCCNKYPHFAKVVKDFEASEKCAKLSVRHYMLKPVQRIPQYRLLLEDYLKKLPNDSPDFVDTQAALAVVSNVASHANDTMKQGTNFMKLLALQDRLTRNQNNDAIVGSNNNHLTNANNNNNNNNNNHYELVRPGRSLLKEGELLKLCRRGMQPRYYILLSDVLLYTSFITSGPGAALRVNYELPLEGMRVETPKAEDFKNEFSVISTSRSFTLQAKSAEERDEWIQALREAIEDNASRRSTFLRAKIPSFQHPSTSSLGKQAPVWIPDDRVTMCQQCTAEFTLTFRRHHCRACGKVVCDHCSSNRAPLQYKRNQSLRVCDTCFEVLQKEFDCKYEGTVTIEDPMEPKLRRVSSLKAQFKRGIKENRSQTRKRVPDRLLEVSASDTASQMCGYLRVMVRRSMQRGWFVLKDRVLYEYRAPQDIRALQTLPVLGYQVEAMDKLRDVADGLDNCLAFQLTHPNQPPIIFHADSPHLAEKWIQAMKEAVVLS